MRRRHIFLFLLGIVPSVVAACHVVGSVYCAVDDDCHAGHLCSCRGNHGQQVVPIIVRFTYHIDKNVMANRRWTQQRRGPRQAQTRGSTEPHGQWWGFSTVHRTESSSHYINTRCKRLSNSQDGFHFVALPCSSTWESLTAGQLAETTTLIPAVHPWATPRTALLFSQIECPSLALHASCQSS